MGNDSMVIELTRFAGTPYGVFGLLLHGPMMLYTLEPSWGDDVGEVSCIPADLYRLMLLDNVDHGRSWTLVDAGQESGRIIRVGNRELDTEGDILIGKSLGALGNDWALKDSAEALGLFHTYMDGETRATLNITWLGSPEVNKVEVSETVLEEDSQFNLDGQIPE